MRSKILPIIESAPRRLYVEPFGGACGLLFGKKPEPEIYNDVDARLCNLFRVLKDRTKSDALLYLCSITPSSRAIYYELRALSQAWARGESITTSKRELALDDYDDATVAAYAFFYVMNNCFHARVNENLAFGGGERDKGAGGTARRYANRRESIPLFCERLQTVTIENMDYRKCVETYDHETTLFYFDPPYDCQSSKVYQDAPTDAKIVDLLFQIKGKWILSCYDTPKYEELLAIAARAKTNAFSTIAIQGTRNSKRVETIYTNITDQTLLVEERT